MLDPEKLREPRPGRAGPGLAEAGRAVDRYEVPPDEPREAIDRYNALAGQYESTIAKALFCAGLTWPGMALAEDRAEKVLAGIYRKALTGLTHGYERS